MLERVFNEIYDKFKLNFYRNIFRNFSDRESSLTASETFCTEVVKGLNRPTINELGEFLRISQPNTAYKVANLVKKGYLTKTQSTEDRRVFFLDVTDKYIHYENVKYEYINLVLSRTRERFSEEDIEKFTEMLTVISNELMPEISEFLETRQK